MNINKGYPKKSFIILGSSNPSEEPDQAAPVRPTTAMRGGSARPRTGNQPITGQYEITWLINQPITGRARPPSARPAAPAIKKKREIALEEQPRPVTAKVGIIIQSH